VRGILISRAEMVAEMKLFEHVRMIFLDGIPTVNRSCVRHLNRVIRKERGPGGVIVAVPYLVKFFKERDKGLRVAKPEISVSLSPADDPSGEICQAQWKNESAPYSRAALLLNGIGIGAS